MNENQIEHPAVICPKALELCKLLSVVEDPRRRQAQRHPLIGILVMALCGVASGADGWEDIADTATLHFEWFSANVPCGKQPPSESTFRRVFQALKPDCVQAVLSAWLASCALENKPGRHIRLDGKALRGSKGTFTVNAYDGEEGVTLAHQLIDKKTNELGALPQLLDQIELEGTICSGDALYAQTRVVETLISRKADYLIALKGNQLGFLAAVENRFGGNYASTKHFKIMEKSRGWLMTRRISVSSEVSHIDLSGRWCGLKSVIRIKTDRNRGEEHETQTRYYISSLEVSPESFANLIRGHWAVENGLHRMLDVHFKEDACRIRHRTAAGNLSILRKLSGAILRRLDPDRTLKSKMKAMMGSPAFRQRFLLCDWYV